MDQGLAELCFSRRRSNTPPKAGFIANAQTIASPRSDTGTKPVEPGGVDRFGKSGDLVAPRKTGDVKCAASLAGLGLAQEANNRALASVRRSKRCAVGDLTGCRRKSETIGS